MRDDRHRTERVADRVRALADEPVPTDVRDRHLLTIRTHEGVSGDAGTPQPVRAWRRRLAPLTAAATALLLFGGGGTVVAAQDAGPSDSLYGVKRASEQVWSSMPRGRERAAEVQLAMAERRLGEARRAPAHAEGLIDEGVANATAAAEHHPAAALDAFGRLLGDGEGRLPGTASPRAREALHRNCLRIAEKHGLSDAPCGEEPTGGEHPGRGQGRDQAPGQTSERGQGAGRDTAPGQTGGQGAGRDAAPGQTGERGRGEGQGRDQAPGQTGERGQGHGREDAPGQTGEQAQGHAHGRDGAPGQTGDHPGKGRGQEARPAGPQGS